MKTGYSAFSLRRINAITVNTLTELTRLKVFYFLLVFAVLLIGSSMFMAQLTFQQEFQILGEAVAALPARCREVVLLRYLDGLAYKEIGTRLGISPETVKVHMAKGVRRCAEFFQERGLLKPGPKSTPPAP